LGLVHFDYSPAWNGVTLHRLEVSRVLDDITELRTFVRIVVACPPPPPRGVFRLVLLVSGWRRWSVGPKCSFSPPASVQTSRAHPD
jgi:hypothetical protein